MNSDSIRPPALIAKLNDLTADIKDKSYIRYRITALSLATYTNNNIIGQSGTRGYGLPAAIGAKMARPDALVSLQARRLAVPEDMAESLEWLINIDGPALLEVITDRKVPVLPMVTGGNGLT